MLTDIRGMNEECGIFGIWGAEKAAQITYYGLHSLQHRGQEGSGIVVKDGERLDLYKGPGLVSEVFTKDIMEKISGTAAVSHARHSTVGKGDIANIQPFLFHFAESSLALCHNGNLVNAIRLRKKLESQGSIFQTSSDSEVLAHLIKRTPFDDTRESIKSALNQVKGGFSYVLLTQTEMIGARDPYGTRPLSIGKLGDAYILASETCAFDVVGAEFIRDVDAGEMIVIDDNGLHSMYYTPDSQMATCSLEFIYFARPDSNISGVNVHAARKSTGKILAREAPVEADVVVAVPDSGISAAVGYSEATQIPYEIGLIKNRYIARTFIEPSQELREKGVKMKLSAVRGVVEGKRVVLIDDSIVRGTTSRRLVELLREVGAKEVHLRVASPALKYPCFYGIDFQTASELIAFRHSIEEIKKLFEVESLSFLSEEGLMEAVNLPFSNKYNGHCMACFNGDYPERLYDYL